jgi:hypothetical protein
MSDVFPLVFSDSLETDDVRVSRSCLGNDTNHELRLPFSTSLCSPTMITTLVHEANGVDALTKRKIDSCYYATVLVCYFL